MQVIKYTPCALTATGLGTDAMFNTDGAIAPLELKAIFDAAKTGGKVDGHDIYRAQLISGDSLTAILASGYVNDSIEANESMRRAYSCASILNGATVVNGLVVTTGGGAAPTYSLPLLNTANVISLTQAVGLSGTDEPFTSNVLANITGLAFAIGANEIWRVEAHIIATPNVGGISRIGIDGPAAPTLVSITSNARTASSGVQHKQLTAFGSEDDFFSWNSAVVNTWDGYGIIHNGANAGTFHMQARTTDGTSTLTILAGSHLIATRIS